MRLTPFLDQGNFNFLPGCDHRAQGLRELIEIERGDTLEARGVAKVCVVGQQRHVEELGKIDQANVNRPAAL